MGDGSLPYLKEIAKSEDKLLASKAVYLSGEISKNASLDIINGAAKDTKPEIRIAAAASLNSFLNSLTDLEGVNTTSIIESINLLQNDQGVGVNKVINKTINFVPDRLSISREIKKKNHNIRKE